MTRDEFDNALCFAKGFAVGIALMCAPSLVKLACAFFALNGGA